MKVRTRFAPSPTGVLHAGSVRTALFAWLYARHHDGAFVLRIEDTDNERSSKESADAICDGLAWLGLDWDEGPFYQSRRMARYAEVIARLLDEGKAYHCYCTRDELDALRREQLAKGVKPRYDGRCREGRAPRAGVEPVVRFKNPQEGAVVFRDHVHGDVETANGELDDLVIARADGAPTYNLTVVVDDMDMAITHVIRGDDHLSNTPRQINIFRALGATPPDYAHVPLILDQQGARLSKRTGAPGVAQYREQGYLPAALLNCLVRLGWAHGDQEVFSLDEMVECFNFGGLNASAAAFDPAKLDWLNGHYLAQTPPESLADDLAARLRSLGCDPAQGPALEAVAEAMKSRHPTLQAMAQGMVFLYKDEITYDAAAARKHATDDARSYLSRLLTALETVAQWRGDALKQTLSETLKDLNIPMGKLGKPLRYALTAGAPGPDISLVMEWLGKDRCLARIRRLLEM
ncbi:MAG: glutamate--tRNA ligase [Gammaproteobacteria bacterium]|nr:glutamate--tRNA ligase [Gammaproteobacteria bacterium]